VSVTIVNLKKNGGAAKRAAEKGLPSNPSEQTPSEVNVHAPLQFRKSMMGPPRGTAASSSSSSLHPKPADR
jgi:hypothetical protein